MTGEHESRTNNAATAETYPQCFLLHTGSEQRAMWSPLLCDRSNNHLDHSPDLLNLSFAVPETLALLRELFTMKEGFYISSFQYGSCYFLMVAVDPLK